MLGTTIREFWKATPFTPFVVQMTDGRQFTIEHPDYMIVSPRGSRIIVYDDDENETHLSGLLVASVAPVRPRRKR